MADAKQTDTNDEPLIPVPNVATGSNQQPESSVDEPKITPSPSATTSDNEDAASKAVEPELPIGVDVPAQPAPAATSNGDLEEIKQKALTELRPLLDEVDLPADQKFHTVLEIVSATNDKTLIPMLYEAASAIEDKHEKAKALVDVVSEIEYLNNEAV